MKIKFGDIVIALAVIAAAGMLLAAFQPADSEAVTALISRDNREIERIDLNALSEPVTVTFKDIGVVIEAENGRIRFVESSCPDKTCVRTGWLDSPGDTAACLPNRVVVTIVGTAEPGDIDMIAE